VEPLDLDLYQFRWPVPDKGFIWEENLTTDSNAVQNRQPPFLIDNPESEWQHYYRPLEKTDLLFKFAGLEADLESIRAFANKYGRLGVGTMYYPPAGGNVVYGESFAVWMRAVNRLKTWVQIWLWIEERDAGKLGQVVRWSNDFARVELVFENNALPLRGFHVIASKETNYRAEFFDRWRPGDVYGPAKLALLEAVNKELKGAVSPCLLLKKDGSLGGFLRPHNLLGALWFQLYQAITGERRYRRCEVCQGWMDTTDSRRHIKQHPECRNRRNARITRAREKVLKMHQEGKPIEEIAAATGVLAADVEAIIRKGMKHNAKENT